MSAVDREALRILEDVLDSDESVSRQAAVAELCGNDAALRARVEQLLARHESATRLLPTEAFIVTRDVLFDLPQRVGPYRVVGEIARGGMGAVVSAERDDGVFHQHVAIKLIRSDIASEQAKRRFEEERHILARLRHPGIVRILDGGEQGGQPWLAMDYVDGQPVTEALRSRQMPRPQVLATFESICDAVSHAHRQLVVHADIKPSNVLMSADNRVHLLDFGIARLLVDLDTAESGEFYPLTRCYAAPERVLEAAPTVAADVFSLGVLLFEMLTGEVPAADARCVEGTRLPEGALGGDLAALVGRALAVDPAQRYPDVSALQEDIRRLRQGWPVLARRDAGWRYRVGKFVHRHQLGVAVSAVVAIALVGAVLFSTAQWLNANRARTEADARFTEVRELARYLLFDLYDQLGASPGTVHTRVQVAGLARGYLDRLSAVPHAPTELRLETAAAYRRLAQVLGISGTASLGRPLEARAALDRSEAILEELLQQQPGNVEALEQRGWIYSDRWTLLAADAESEQVNRTARSYFESALAIEPTRASAQLGVLNTQRCEAYALIKGSDQPQRARVILERALSGLRRLKLPRDMQETARLLEYQMLSNLGDALYYGGEENASLPQYQAALALADEELRTNGDAPAWLSRRGEALWNISGVLEENPARLDEALSAVEAGISALNRVLGFGPDANAEKKLSILYSQQGMLLVQLHRESPAIEAMQKSIDIRESRLRAAPEDGARLRDLTIGQMSFSEVLDAAGQRRRACAMAGSARQGWQQIEVRGEMTSHDRNSNAQRATTIAREYCGNAR